LPPAAENQPIVQVRIITTDARWPALTVRVEVLREDA